MSEDHLPWPAHRVHAVDAAPPGVTSAALAGTTIAYATGTALYAASTIPGTPVREVLALPWPTAQLTLSLSGRYAAVRRPRGDRLIVVDLTNGATLDFGEEDVDRPASKVAAFAGDRDVLLLSRNRYELEILELPAGTVLTRASFVAPMPFVFDSLHPVTGSDTVMAIGHMPGEGKDSLVAVSLAEMMDDPAAAGTEFRRRRGPNDYSYQLAVGPCGSDAIVGHRNPEYEPGDVDEGDEDPVEDLAGFYVRRLPHGELVEMIPDEEKLDTAAPMFATADCVVVGGAGVVRFVPRSAAGAGAATSLVAPVYALDPAGRRILAVDGTAPARLYELT